MTDDARQMIEACTEMIRQKGHDATMEMLSCLQKGRAKRLDPIHHDHVKMLALAAAHLALEGLVVQLKDEESDSWDNSEDTYDSFDG